MTTFGDQVFQFGGVPVSPDYGGCWGNHYFVDGTDGAEHQGGKKPSEALQTVAQALSAAGNYDTIVLKHGNMGFNEDSLEISKTALRLTGCQPHGGCIYGSYIYSNAGNLLTVTANGVEISNMSFLAYGDTYNCIKWADETPTITYQGYLHDCGFMGSDVGEHGVYMAHGGEAGQLVIERCNFQGFATACIAADGSFNMIKDSFFDVMTAKVGIQVVATARPWMKIISNYFFTDDATNADGIVFTGTPTVGNLLIDNNHFQNFAGDSDCIETVNGYSGLNYNNEAAIAVTSA